jgi:hypothetical protein
MLHKIQHAAEGYEPIRVDTSRLKHFFRWNLYELEELGMFSLPE